MKKLILGLISIILITGCTTEEKEIKSPDGDSKAYLFFENYNPEKYTLKMHNGDQKITIIKLDNQTYHETKSPSETIITIEKDNQKYTINQEAQTYTKEFISTIQNFADGYLPSSAEYLKNKSYKTGTTREGFISYTYEAYVYDGITTTYYFQNNKLKKIETKTALNETKVDFDSLSSKVDEDKFNIPKDYEEISY